MTNAAQDFQSLVCHTQIDRNRLLALDVGGLLKDSLSPRHYADFLASTGIFRLGITIGERSALFKQYRDEAAGKTGAENAAVAKVLASYGIGGPSAPAIIDFVLSNVPALLERIEHAKLYIQEREG